MKGKDANSYKEGEAEPSRPTNFPYCEGVELAAQKSSPPVLGGVSAGRGGNSQISNLPRLKTFRKTLRSNLTPAEARFWTIIKNKQFEGRKFRRQHSIGNYIFRFLLSVGKTCN